MSAKLSGTESLENLIRLLDESFDVMNARCPIGGITEKNWNGECGRRAVYTTPDNKLLVIFFVSSELHYF